MTLLIFVNHYKNVKNHTKTGGEEKGGRESGLQALVCQSLVRRLREGLCFQYGVTLIFLSGPLCVFQLLPM